MNGCKTCSRSAIRLCDMHLETFVGSMLSCQRGLHYFKVDNTGSPSHISWVILCKCYLLVDGSLGTRKVRFRHGDKIPFSFSSRLAVSNPHSIPSLLHLHDGMDSQV